LEFTSPDNTFSLGIPRLPTVKAYRSVRGGVNKKPEGFGGSGSPLRAGRPGYFAADSQR
jgi:hypothetical protein